MNQYYYGRHAVMELIKSGKSLNKVLLTKGLNDHLVREIKRGLKDSKTPIKFVDKKILDGMFPGENHQGMAVEASAKEYVEWEEILKAAEEKGEDPFIVILDSIEDPHNFGAIIRSAEAAGVHGIIIPKNRSVSLSEGVAKTAVGALDNVLISRVTNIAQTIDRLKEKNIWVYGTVLEGNNIYKENLSGPIAVVIGNEAKGIGQNIIKKCDFLLTIPMIGKVNSLNASVAAGITLFEIVRQKTLNNPGEK